MQQNISLAIRNVDNEELLPFLLYAVNVKKDYDRALMIRLSCELTKGEWHDAIPAMICAELLDFSICIVDDILDLSVSRLGKPTFSKRWNTRYALNVAFILKSLAIEMLLKSDFLLKIGSNHLVEINHLFERSHREVYEGQFQDVRFEEFPFDSVTSEMYLKMIRYTSGAQGAAYCKIGAIISKADKKQIEALGIYGMCMGTIFQIRDDFIDYIDAEDEIGKPPFRDFLQGKRRLPMIIGWKYFSNSEKTYLSGMMKKYKLNKTQKRQILSIILKDEVIENTKRIVARLKEEGLNALDVFRANTKAKNALVELIKLGASL